MANKRYCYIEPKFPKDGYFISIFINDPVGGNKILYPMSSMLGSVREAINYVQVDAAKTKREKFNIYGAIVFKIVFKEKIPLIREYWEEGSGEIGSMERMLAFIKMVDYPRMYRILIVPKDYHQTTKSFDFGVSYPFLISSDNKTVEAFMYKSEEYVNFKAKYAAMYTVEEVYGINWETGETKKVEEVGASPELLN